MLSLKNPELKNILSQHEIGLLVLRSDTGKLILIAKMSKEILLGMKLRKGFELSFVEYEFNGGRAHALLTLIYDTSDEPLSITNTLFDVPQSRELIELLSQEDFEVYGFDEHDREFFGRLAKVNDIQRFREFKESLVLRACQKNIDPDFEDVINMFYQATENNNEKGTFFVDLVSEVYPEFSHFIDTTKLIQSPSSELEALHYSLERKEPGSQQELDIFLLLEKIFWGDDIFLNPIRLDNGEEFCDILVVTDQNILIVQAKDSPNTAASLATTIARKKSKTLSHLDKAVRQLVGAINHAKQNKILKFKLDDEIIELDLLEREVFGLAVVKELFDEDRKSYMVKLIEPYRSTGVPSIVLSYMDLHYYSCYVDSEVFFDVIRANHTESIKCGIMLETKFQIED